MLHLLWLRKYKGALGSVLYKIFLALYLEEIWYQISISPESLHFFQIYSSDVCPLETTEVGQKVFCDVGKFKPGLTWCRGCVLETFQEENFCSILLVDYGFVVQINIDQLFLLPEILGQLPHQVCVWDQIFREKAVVPLRPKMISFQGSEALRYPDF